MPRVLLLLPTKTYRAEALLTAAQRLGVAATVGSEEPSTLEALNPGALLTLDFHNPGRAAQAACEFAQKYPIDAVIPVDEETAEIGACISSALGLRSNSIAAAQAAGNKHRMRELLSRGGVPVPFYQLVSLDDDPDSISSQVDYPCVLKPLALSASRGVIRANSRQEFVGAFHRIGSILRSPDLAGRRALPRKILVEDFISGKEVALEGLLTGGELRVLALFDKPDPLDGPFFEETLYITPSCLNGGVQAEIFDTAARATRALGLTEGPVHAELRINERGAWLIEVAARSIGGRCSAALKFGAGASLEEVVLRHALGMPIESLAREKAASGVMMIPIPRAGILENVQGIEAAKSVSGIEEINLTTPLGRTLTPLPEGSTYVGFIFARGETPLGVESALREAHQRLHFTIRPPSRAGSSG